MTIETSVSAHEPAATGDGDIVLAVDLDGTLCRTDTLHEGFLRLITLNPGALLTTTHQLTAGRVKFKKALADQTLVDSQTLPLNPDVVAELRTVRTAGRRIVLVSAADQRQAEAVADATDLFDEVHGSTSDKNLKGTVKAAFLVDRFGEKGFDYMGDSNADLPVWAAARQAITVGAANGLRRRAEAINPNTRHISAPAGNISMMLRAMRPHQWSKNLLVFLPMLAAQDLGNAVTVLLSFLAFCLIASSVYIINDLLDITADRLHPRKCKRPFAAGDLSALTGMGLVAGLLATALILIGLTANPPVLGVLVIYFVLTLAYSAWLKRKLIIDILLLAGLYTIRVLVGGVAASVPLSPWLMGFSLFIFLALAAIKRQAELNDQLKNKRASAGRAYLVEDLPILRAIAIGAGQAAVLVLALYLTSETVSTLYSTPTLLWGLAPILLYWILRMVMKTHRGLMHDDPIVYAATDRVSLFILITCTCLILAAV